MRDRARQINVAHAFAAHLGKRHFHAALFTNDAAVLQTLVLAAKALVILHRPKIFAQNRPSRSGFWVR